MNELLSVILANPAVVMAISTAALALISIGVEAIQCGKRWLKSKFPKEAELVESNYCYIQPCVESALASLITARANGVLNGTVVANIITASVADFVTKYYKLEGKDPTVAEVAAARADITAVLGREAGGI